LLWRSGTQKPENSFRFFFKKKQDLNSHENKRPILHVQRLKKGLSRISSCIQFLRTLLTFIFAVKDEVTPGSKILNFRKEVDNEISRGQKKAFSRMVPKV